MASNNPNIQNLPTGVYRDAFALDSGSVISSDFGNQEMRTAACISGEEVMLQVFTEGHPE
jgi:DNA polymerase I-like protein with 3'-5' exonuclease and polymerase domains